MDLLDLEQIRLSKKFYGSESSSGPNGGKVKFFFRSIHFDGTKNFSRKKFCLSTILSGIFWAQSLTIPLTKNKKDLKEVKQI